MEKVIWKKLLNKQKDITKKYVDIQTNGGVYVNI